MQNKIETDYIVVGAGSAGCVVSARLSEIDSCEVCLLESGRMHKFDPWIKIPLGVGKLFNNRNLHWQFETETEPALNNRRIYCPTGKLVGGSGNINGLLFVRGQPYEYDNLWSTHLDNWKYSNVLPFFKKLETTTIGDSSSRGRNGPIYISEVPHYDQLSDAFFQSCLEKGIKHNVDYNSGNSAGVSKLQINAKHGLRSSSAFGYLYPALKRKNLRLYQNRIVKKLIFDKTRVVGVVVGKSGQKDEKFYARKEVILCSGAINTPKILELSGVGNFDKLKPLGLDNVLHLPGVGENLQDHLNNRLSFECRQPITINDLMHKFSMKSTSFLDYLLFRRGLIATPGLSVHGLIPCEENPNIIKYKIHLTHLSGESRYSMTKTSGVDPFSGFMLGVTSLHPTSQGSVHIRSNNYLDNPKINANYLSTTGDIEDALRGIKLLRNISKQKSFEKVIKGEIRPGCEILSDKNFLEYIRRTAQTSWHFIGSCKMGGDAMAVVDTELKVHGTESLRIADASVLPNQISSNTNAPSMMIGERCAEFIKKSNETL